MLEGRQHNPDIQEGRPHRPLELPPNRTHVVRLQTAYGSTQQRLVHLVYPTRDPLQQTEECLPHRRMLRAHLPTHVRGP